MKTLEDEAFEELERRQGGGFPAKRAMAADRDALFEKFEVAQPAQEPVAWMWKDMRGQNVVSLFEPRLNSIPLYIIPPMPAQETTAIHQFRSPRSVNWYDGFPDHHDGSGPYEVRTLYAAPPKREWVGLTDEEIAQGNKESWVDKQAWQSAVWWAEAKLKEKNNAL
jgi:hypothetical protein